MGRWTPSLHNQTTSVRPDWAVSEPFVGPFLWDGWEGLVNDWSVSPTTRAGWTRGQVPFSAHLRAIGGMGWEGWEMQGCKVGLGNQRTNVEQTQRWGGQRGSLGRCQQRALLYVPPPTRTLSQRGRPEVIPSWGEGRYVIPYVIMPLNTASLPPSPRCAHSPAATLVCFRFLSDPLPLQPPHPSLG